jgi:hypothetical protein
MAKSPRRAKNKVEGSAEGTLIKVEPDTFAEAPTATHRTRAVVVARSTVFTTELEEVIEIIAKERVYRAMLDSLGRRLRIPHLMDEFDSRDDLRQG